MQKFKQKSYKNVYYIDTKSILHMCCIKQIIQFNPSELSKQ
jgi:hypothetical protein